MCDLSCAPTSGLVRYILERIVSPLGDNTKIDDIILVANIDIRWEGFVSLQVGWYRISASTWLGVTSD